MHHYAGQECWLVLTLVVGFSLTTSKAGTPGSPWRHPRIQAVIYDDTNSGAFSSEHSLPSQPPVLRRHEEIVSKSTDSDQSAVHDNTDQQSNPTVWRTASASPARMLLHLRGLRNRPAGKNPRGPGDSGRGSGISRGTSSPSKGRVTRRADAGSSGNRNSGSRSGSSGSSSSSSRRQSSNFGSRSTRRSTSRDTSTISTYQWLLEDSWRP